MFFLSLKSLNFELEHITTHYCIKRLCPSKANLLNSELDSKLFLSSLRSRIMKKVAELRSLISSATIQNKKLGRNAPPEMPPLISAGIVFIWRCNQKINSNLKTCQNAMNKKSLGMQEFKKFWQFLGLLKSVKICGTLHLAVRKIFSFSLMLIWRNALSRLMLQSNCHEKFTSEATCPSAKMKRDFEHPNHTWHLMN